MTLLRECFNDADDILDVSSTPHQGDIIIVYKGKKIMIEIKNKNIVSKDDVTKYETDLK